MKRIFLGSNPIAFGAPGAEEPVIIDMSTTHAAWGKVIVARPGRQAYPARLGRRLGRQADHRREPGRRPRPHRRPQGLRARAMIEILCAHLAGVPFGRHVTKMYGELDKPRNLGHFMLALDVARFTDPRRCVLNRFRGSADPTPRAFRPERETRSAAAKASSEARPDRRTESPGVAQPDLDLGGVGAGIPPRSLRAFSPRRKLAEDRAADCPPDRLELDRGTLDREDAIRRAAHASPCRKPEIRQLLLAVPPSLVPFTDTVDLLYRLKARG